MSGRPLGGPWDDVAAADGEGPSDVTPRVEDPETMLDRLQRLLQKQVDLVHRGRLAAAVELFDQTDQCVQGIAGARESGTPGSAQQWQCIERLYGELSLTLTAQRTEVAAALNAIRQGQKVLKTYGSYLSST